MLLVGEDDSWLDELVAPLAAIAEQLPALKLLAANQAESCKLEWGWLNNRPLCAQSRTAPGCWCNSSRISMRTCLARMAAEYAQPGRQTGYPFQLARLYLLENRPRCRDLPEAPRRRECRS